jgi:cell division protein FtsL
MKKLFTTLFVVASCMVVNKALAMQQPSDSLYKKLEVLEKKLHQQQQEITQLKQIGNSIKKPASHNVYILDRRGGKQWYKKPQ